MRFARWKKPVSLSNKLKKDLDVTKMGAGYKRGMILKIYKAKLAEAIGCKPKKYYRLQGIVPYTFEFPLRRGPGGCIDIRKHTLQPVNKSGLTQDQKDRVNFLLSHLRYAKIKPQDGPQYSNPTLVIYFQPGSPWITELHHRRYQLQGLINKRLKSEFLKEVKIK